MTSAEGAFPEDFADTRGARGSVRRSLYGSLWIPQIKGAHTMGTVHLLASTGPLKVWRLVVIT